MTFEQAKNILDTFSKTAKLYRNNAELKEIKAVKLDKIFLTQYPIKTGDILMLDNKSHIISSVSEGPNQLYFEGAYILDAHN